MIKLEVVTQLTKFTYHLETEEEDGMDDHIRFRPLALTKFTYILKRMR